MPPKLWAESANGIPIADCEANRKVEIIRIVAGIDA